MKPIYKILFSISAFLTVVSLAFIFMYGFNLGVDFKGGSVLELAFDQRPDIDQVAKVLSSSNVPVIKDASITPSGSNDIILKTGELSEAQHQELTGALTTAFPKSGVKEKKFDSVGPVIGNELKHKSVTAVVIVLIAISLYIAIVFRKMAGTLSPWAMSVAALMALLHDLIIPMGVFAWLGHAQGIEIGAVFVAAVLTILGYSISDTVVVFDRVRENMLRGGTREPFAQVVHRSIVETLARSINTSVTTLLSLVAIYFFGGESVKYFALALIIGIVMGAFSSISVASPILVWWSRKK
jgi:preprotein translocase subunit SecF